MSTEPLSGPIAPDHDFRRVAILFSGGPAPAANAVISTAAASFLRQGIPVYGILHGYSGLVEHSDAKPVSVGQDYLVMDNKVLKRTRNSQGILLGTSRANPGKMVSNPEHLKDPERTAPLQTVYDALRYLEVDALISIGGNDTLTTANKMNMFQKQLPADAPRIPVVHLPKTIDNDYSGIDFTFGFFTAADTLATEINNLLADAEANNAYFLAETMGRSAGWLSYAAAIAGEASLVISVEDIQGEFRDEEAYTDANGQERTRATMKVDLVVKRIVKTMLVREERERKKFGVIVIGEGLAEYLPQSYLKGIPRDDFGHIAISQVDLGRRFASWIAEEYEKQSGRKRKITGLQLGYESRCAKPHAFDVMLGSQLGVGAYRALVEEKLDGVMVSVSGQLDLRYVPFSELIDAETLDTKVRFIEPGSDFHRLARFMETNINE